MKQPDLFAERQAARQLRDQGAQRAADHADRMAQEWSVWAYAALVQYIKRRPTSVAFTAEDVRAACDLPDPPDRRAWGSVVLRAARAGLIRKVGYRPHHARSRHCGVSTVWEPLRPCTPSAS